MQKGLFSSLFLITMIVLFTPTLIIPEQSRYIVDTYNHLNLLTLSADNVIKDALFEETFSNGCLISTEADYENEVGNFLDRLFNDLDTDGYYPFSCEYDNLNTSLSGDVYSGSVELKCTIYSDYSLINLDKELIFENQIDPTPGLFCNIVIKDLLDSSKEYVNITR